jgi:hypothetical protein
MAIGIDRQAEAGCGVSEQTKNNFSERGLFYCSNRCGEVAAKNSKK